jgi:hypothetical protein
MHFVDNSAPAKVRPCSKRCSKPYGPAKRRTGGAFAPRQLRRCRCSSRRVNLFTPDPGAREHQTSNDYRMSGCLPESNGSKLHWPYPPLLTSRTSYLLIAVPLCAMPPAATFTQLAELTRALRNRRQSELPLGSVCDDRSMPSLATKPSDRIRSQYGCW